MKCFDVWRREFDENKPRDLIDVLKVAVQSTNAFMESVFHVKLTFELKAIE